MNTFDLYQQLADANATQGRFQERDRFLVLAIDAAQQAGRIDLAEQWRQHLLQLNPHHLVKPYGSFQEAVLSPNFGNYLQQLRRNFPPNKAQELLNELSRPAIVPFSGGPTVQSYSLREEPAVSTNPDPLAHVPVSAGRPTAPPPLPYQLQPARPMPLAAPPPSLKRKEAVYSASGALIGNVLFVALLGLGLAILGYVIVWPALR
jgi:hypothetical protein